MISLYKIKRNTIKRIAVRYLPLCIAMFFTFGLTGQETDPSQITVNYKVVNKPLGEVLLTLSKQTKLILVFLNILP